MKSLWTSTIPPIPKRPSLPGNITTEVVIIGAGMCGILIGYFLMLEGKQVVIVDANRIGSGQSHITTAKITAQHGLFYHNLIQQVGLEKATQYATANQKAIKQYEQIIEREEIACNFEFTTSYLYTTTESKKLELEKTAALRLGIPCEYDSNCALPFSVAGRLGFSNQAQFHPLAFLSSLSRSLVIYENTKVTQVKENEVITEKGTLFCKQVVFACHYPFQNIPGYYFTRMHQERSYVIALRMPNKASYKKKNPLLLDGMYYGIDPDGLSFRNYHSILLLGGGSHRTGKNKRKGNYQSLLRKAYMLYPNCELVASWSAQDCITLDHIPYIGTFSSSRPNWYVATGFKKWGMTHSMVAATMLSDMICHRTSPYIDVFSPERPFSKQAMANLCTELKETTIALSKEFLTYPISSITKLPTGEGKVIHFHGKKVGAYKDEKGHLYLVSTKCPHLGCQLSWNPEEKSWDCPCHGSRFDYRGHLIDNPAQTNCSVKK